MRLLFVADGRSPIARNWIAYFIAQGHEVHLASTFACDPGNLRLASLHVTPVAFSGLKAGDLKAGSSTTPGLAPDPSQAAPRPPAPPPNPAWGAALVGLRTRVRQWLGPFTLPAAARGLQAVIARVQPDLVHAMRIPYEGMLAALALGEHAARPASPLLLSVWGNDFTLHAPSTPLMGRYTRLALRRAAALHADCHRDVRLAHKWGFPAACPAVVLPGAGGVQPGLFYPPDPNDLASGGLTVINPRGVRAYVRNDTFFRAVPLVLQHQPQARFVCPTMAGEPQASRWLAELGIEERVDLLPAQTRAEMASLFRSARVAVSPSTHDGTPNTLLEAMACGCFPVAGDIESLREWITPGANGLLVDPADPHALAAAILTGLEDPELRARAQTHNLRLIAERATYDRVMAEAERFYSSFSSTVNC